MRKTLLCLLFLASPLLAQEKHALQNEWQTLKTALSSAGFSPARVLDDKHLTADQLPPELAAKTLDFRARYRLALAAMHNARGIGARVELEIEPNDSLNIANPFNDLEAYRGSIPRDSNDEDWYRIDVTDAREAVVLNVTNTTGELNTSDSVLEIYNAAGQLILLDDDGGELGGESRIAFFPTVTGPLYARLRAFSAASSVDRYDLFRFQSRFEREPEPIAAGETQTKIVHLHPNDALQAAVLVRDESGVRADLDLVLRDEQGQIVATAFTGAANFEYLFVDDIPSFGRYTLEIQAFDIINGPAEYEFAIRYSSEGEPFPVPTLSTGALAGLASLLALSGLRLTRRRRGVS